MKFIKCQKMSHDVCWVIFHKRKIVHRNKTCIYYYYLFPKLQLVEFYLFFVTERSDSLISAHLKIKSFLDQKHIKATSKQIFLWYYFLLSTLVLKITCTFEAILECYAFLLASFAIRQSRDWLSWRLISGPSTS